ncbi:MAG: shikimate dehydrogenase family protein [Thermoplasmataceae archaeon]
MVGRPVGHSVGQFVFNRIFSASGYGGIYISMDVTGENLPRLTEFARKGMDGFNVTIPHKVEIMKLLDRYDPVVTATGSCNTVLNEDGLLCGYNTDYSGFVKTIEELRHDIEGKNILIAGTGGIFRSVCMALLTEFHPGRITALSRNPEAAGKKLSDFRGIKRIGIEGYGELDGKYHVLVNCSPAGMHPDVHSMPFSGDLIESSEIIIDTVYNPPETILVKAGLEKGKKCITGLDLYIYQALESLKIFTGIDSTYREVRDLVEEAWKSGEFGRN